MALVEGLERPHLAQGGQALGFDCHVFLGMFFSSRGSHTGPTQEVTERLIQHPQKQQELPELPLHRLLTLLKVPVLERTGGE